MTYTTEVIKHPIEMETRQRVLMTLETEESRSSLDMKQYVMPKKGSGFSWAFCFSSATVYTSEMESTAHTHTQTTTNTQVDVLSCHEKTQVRIFSFLLLLANSLPCLN